MNIDSTHRRQSFFALTAIQVTGATSLPVLNSGIQLYHQYGFLFALSILLLGNCVVWLLALAIVRMTANTTKNTLDNVKDYLGLLGSWSVGVVLITSTISYYVTQTNLTAQSILALFPFNEGFQINQFFQVGVVLGVVSVLSIIQGISGLKWLASISFPVIIVAFLGLLIFFPDSQPVHLRVPSSIGGLAIALGTSLSVAVDYPTFFQHSKSKRTSLIAVSLIQLITFLIGLGGLYLGKYVGIIDNLAGWGIVFHGTMLVKILFFLIVVLSCLCVNTVNVYSASIAWELLAPDFLLGKKEYTILGLGLTAVFILTTGIVSVEFLLTVTDIALANLCIVLVLGYLGKLLLGAPLTREKFILYGGWLLGSAFAVAMGIQKHINLPLFLAGFAFSILAVVLLNCTKAIQAAFQGR